MRALVGNPPMLTLNLSKTQYKPLRKNEIFKVGIWGCLRYHHKVQMPRVRGWISGWIGGQILKYFGVTWDLSLIRMNMLRQTWDTSGRYIWKFSDLWACLVRLQLMKYRLVFAITSIQWTSTSSSDVFSWRRDNTMCKPTSLSFVSL